jgi:hypothetical protein
MKYLLSARGSPASFAASADRAAPKGWYADRVNAGIEKLPQSPKNRCERPAGRLWRTGVKYHKRGVSFPGALDGTSTQNSGLPLLFNKLFKTVFKLITNTKIEVL